MGCGDRHTRRTLLSRQHSAVIDRVGSHVGVTWGDVGGGCTSAVMEQTREFIDSGLRQVTSVCRDGSQQGGQGRGDVGCGWSVLGRSGRAWQARSRHCA